eukprot:TRINITY_DN4370_c0_g4_i2.p1 TRINITY_DN4370_c0_g4~~TRINITY_DN4370_c0_g4_i2.p1  ORF type:complete len:148 (-),score=15.91 TRINITY_DN4370_c0_g4_i2:21-464(-)
MKATKQTMAAANNFFRKRYGRGKKENIYTLTKHSFSLRQRKRDRCTLINGNLNETMYQHRRDDLLDDIIHRMREQKRQERKQQRRISRSILYAFVSRKIFLLLEPHNFCLYFERGLSNHSSCFKLDSFMPQSCLWLMSGVSLKCEAS